MLLLQSRPFVFFYVANQQNPFIPSRQPSSLSRSKIGYNALLSTSCGLKFCAVAALKGPHKQYYAGKSDSCGVQTHALTDWRLKPAPETTRPNCPGRQLDMSTRLLSSCLQPLTIICPSFGQCPYRLVVHNATSQVRLLVRTLHRSMHVCVDQQSGSAHMSSH